MQRQFPNVVASWSRPPRRLRIMLSIPRPRSGVMLRGRGRDQGIAQFDAVALVVPAKIYTGSLSRLDIDRDAA